MDMSLLLGAVIAGLGATLVMDLWNLSLRRGFGIASLNYCLLGRWVRHMADGRFRHASIGVAAPKSFECAMGWLSHYAIGVVFAVAWVAATGGTWLARPTLLPVVLYGMATVVFPFFLLQPALGLGVAAARAPKPAQARLKSLATHTVFGIGLYLAGQGVSAALRVLARAG